MLFPIPYQLMLNDAFCPNDCEVTIPPKMGY